MILKCKDKKGRERCVGGSHSGRGKLLIGTYGLVGWGELPWKRVLKRHLREEALEGVGWAASPHEREKPYS